MVFKFLACWVLRKIKIKFLLASLKTLTNSKSCSENRRKFLFRLCSHWSIYSSVHDEYIHSRLSEQFSVSQTGFGTNFEGTDGYQKAGSSSLKRITGRNFTIVSYFIEASRNFILDFLHKKINKTCVNHKLSFKKNCFKFYIWHYPFNISFNTLVVFP